MRASSLGLINPTFSQQLFSLHNLNQKLKLIKIQESRIGNKLEKYLYGVIIEYEDPTHIYGDRKRSSSIMLIKSATMRKIIIVLKSWRIKT